MAEIKISTSVLTQKREDVSLEAEFSEDTLRFYLDGKLQFAMDFDNFKEFSNSINKVGESLNK